MVHGRYPTPERRVHITIFKKNRAQYLNVLYDSPFKKSGAVDVHGPTSGMRPSIVFWRKPPVFAQKRRTQKRLHIPTTRAANFLQFYEAARLPTFGTWVELWELWLHTNTDKYMYSTLIFNYSIAVLLAAQLASNLPLSQSACLPSKRQQSQKIDMSIHKSTFYSLPKTYGVGKPASMPLNASFSTRLSGILPFATNHKSLLCSFQLLGS